MEQSVYRNRFLMPGHLLRMLSWTSMRPAIPSSLNPLQVIWLEDFVFCTDNVFAYLVILQQYLRRYGNENSYYILARFSTEFNDPWNTLSVNRNVYILVSLTLVLDGYFMRKQHSRDKTGGKREYLSAAWNMGNMLTNS